MVGLRGTELRSWDEMGTSLQYTVMFYKAATHLKHEHVQHQNPSDLSIFSCLLI